MRIDEKLVTGHQQAVRDVFLGTDKHILLSARAGCGKTTMILDLVSFLPAGAKAIYFVFNTKNAKEARQRMDGRIPAMTSHAFGYQWIRKFARQAPEKADMGKVYRLVNRAWPRRRDENYWKIRKAVLKLVSLARNYAYRSGDDVLLSDLLEWYPVDVDRHLWLQVVQVAEEVLELCLPENCQWAYDFEDMLWWPVVLDWGLPDRFDVVFVDEVQDFNICQQQVLAKMVRAGSRIVAVGDPYQAVYRFRGADAHSYEKIREMLGKTDKGCLELPLPENFRCGRKIIQFVQQNTHVQDIQAWSGATEGEVRMVQDYGDVLSWVAKMMQKEEGSMAILCRTNAPLMKCAFDLIDRGVKIKIMGKDIAQKLMEVINSLTFKKYQLGIRDFLMRLDEWWQKMREKFEEKEEYAPLLAEYEDVYHCLEVLSLRSKSVEEMVQMIESYFTDDTISDKDVVALSSGHRAKGMEWDQVAILRPDLLPHPHAVTEADLAQEHNIRYVMYTRAKQSLVICQSKDPG